MNDEYIPPPSRNAARFVVHTPRMRIIVMSIRGWRLRTSVTIQAPQITIPTENSPTVLTEVQPHLFASEIAISTQHIATLINVAASQLTFPGTRTGDSGMNRHVNTAARTVVARGIQK